MQIPFVSLLVLALFGFGAVPSHADPSAWTGKFREELLDPRFEIQVVAKVQEDHAFAGFLPRPGGQVLVLDAAERGLKELEGETLRGSIPLRVPGADPEASFLVDLAPGPEGRILVLDQGLGQILEVDLATKRVAQRYGHLLTPTRVGLGLDGRVYSYDAERGRLVRFFQGNFEGSLEISDGVFAGASPAGELFSIDFDDTKVSLRAFSGRAISPDGDSKPKALAEWKIPVPAGWMVFSAEILGLVDGRLNFTYTLGRLEDPGPRVRHMGRSVWKGGAEASFTKPQRVRWPVSLNQCMDCGPDLRLGAKGDFFGFLFRGKTYRVLAYPKKTWLPWGRN